FIATSNITDFDEKLSEELSSFNNQYFPVPEYKYQVRKKIINESVYSVEKKNLFLPVYKKLVHEYGISLKQRKKDTFLDKWYFQHIRNEIDVVLNEINKIQRNGTKQIISVILSRTVRSCRATTHADLATLVEPVTSVYYCAKHGKMCKPLFSMLKWWKTYSKDTIKRLQQFDALRTNTYQLCLTGDSRTIDIFKEIEQINQLFGNLVTTRKISGIFSSPPYVGLIDYHEQHAYAYDLFGFKRNDDLEIGPLFRGQGKEAVQSYVEGISAVLNNCKKYLANNYNVFLVANDKYGVYPVIAENAGMKIVNQFKRPVLNRTEKDKTAYSETIFHLKEKQENE
ncbi:MAG: site-specific DNA-methyltransferase, partial [Treponema sp.]|nr:site-specific DNA-methyltransferase [Treponema sp.]